NRCWRSSITPSKKFLGYKDQLLLFTKISPTCGSTSHNIISRFITVRFLLLIPITISKHE
ncbi:MAG TPA: hypothetical protein VNB95_01775, partial [Nitrososphaera sp.]|nr:hypothetical protein [Nitrososphaera sp.]